jgi:hypothetical protein
VHAQPLCEFLGPLETHTVGPGSDAIDKCKLRANAFRKVQGYRRPYVVALEPQRVHPAAESIGRGRSREGDKNTRDVGERCGQRRVPTACTCNLQSPCMQTKDARKTGAPACPITPQHPLMRTCSRPRVACRPRPRRRCRAESAGPGCNSDLQWRSTT